MPKKLWPLAAVLVSAVFLTLLFGKEQIGIVITAMAGLVFLFIALRSEVLKAAASRWPKAFVAVGVVIVVLSFVGLLAVDLEIAPAISAGVTMLGIMVAMLPRSYARLADSERAIQRAKADENRPVRFSGADEALQVFRFMVKQRGPLMRLLTPCLVFTAALFFALMALSHGMEAASRSEALWLLVVLGAIIVLYAMMTPVLSIAWCRFVVGGEPPALLARPFRPLWSYVWRLVIALSVLNGIEDLAVSRGVGLLTGIAVEAEAAEAILRFAISALLLLGAAPFAAVFPGLAVGASLNASTAAFQARTLGLGFYWGAILTAGPLWLALALLDLIDTTPEAETMGLATVGIGVLYTMVMLLGVVAISTYLSRVYMLTRDAEAGATDPRTA
ncbi:hypothetical protein M9M90_19630 [Phenylobacterium sp. LH3H17]|uniref:hypothetical protein n=1 Tax=Phenylobacterium sp. LH3H17 TaxID=2903901 RepID=UPI0020C951B8|nr:hypothetical protein [Phenylobacterium sp. LH3H17]UTP39394.1 hypothetical protein M9M90_19630 [Phenylobacterium sp. LH3H17]